jgi:DNA-binding beta-propeller fold protein YncE
VKQNSDVSSLRTNITNAPTRRRFLLTSGAAVAGACLSSRLSLANNTSRADSYRFVESWPGEGAPEVMCRGIDADAGGRIYVAGDADHPVIIFSEDGEYLGEWEAEVLATPHGLRIQDDTVWISDVETHMVHQFSLDGTLIRSFGEKGVAGDEPERFNKPTDFAFGPDGSVYVSDGYLNTRVVCLTSDGKVKKIWGEPGKGPGQFNLVHAIAIDAKSRVVVADRTNRRLQLFNLEGRYLTEWNDIGTPYGLCACVDGSLFVCGLDVDGERFRVVKLDGDGKVLAEFGKTGDEPGDFLMAHSLYVNANNAVYVADGKANCVQKFTPID